MAMVSGQWSVGMWICSQWLVGLWSVVSGSVVGDFTKTLFQKKFGALKCWMLKANKL